MEKKLFGYTKDNKEIYSYIIKDGDLEAEIINFGCVVRRLTYKGVDVVLGYDSVSEYENPGNYYGCVVGRYANRINKGKFELSGREYQLNCNDGNNHLHGGVSGMCKRVWNAEGDNKKVTLSYLSPDGEENYPGNMTVNVEYSVEDNSLIINYRAISDKDTLCNLTNHSYFNLNGQGNGDILNHTLKINASHYTPVDDELIPTGEIKSVKNTVFDFTEGKKVGEDISCKFDGYDVNYCLDSELAAVLSNGRISMEVYTDEAGIQLFSGNNIDDVGKNKEKYVKYGALCLETQTYPDSINKVNFPSPILKAGEEYKTKTVYKFLGL